MKTGLKDKYNREICLGNTIEYYASVLACQDESEWRKFQNIVIYDKERTMFRLKEEPYNKESLGDFVEGNYIRDLRIKNKK